MTVVHGHKKVWCPWCCCKSHTQPTLSPMSVLFVEADKPHTVQPYCAPHFKYICPRCGLALIVERLFER